MDTTATHRSKPQWRYERPHRVRLFTQNLHFNDAAELNPNQIYWHCAEHFSKTDQYRWVEENSIKIEYAVDEGVTAWYKTVMFYADLSESEYVDYSLRFFRHGKDWK
jgi:hypothetical protein